MQAETARDTDAIGIARMKMASLSVAVSIATAGTVTSKMRVAGVTGTESVENDTTVTATAGIGSTPRRLLRRSTNGLLKNAAGGATDTAVADVLPAKRQPPLLPPF